MNKYDEAAQTQLEAWKAQARQTGVDSALAAASWCVDGNTSEEHIRRVLKMIDDGDPQTSDHLPPYPNLSGEWADELTPGKLYEEVTGRDAHADASWNQAAYQSLLEELCEQFEEGVSDTFEIECERLLRAAVSA